MFEKSCDENGNIEPSWGKWYVCSCILKFILLEKILNMQLQLRTD